MKLSNKKLIFIFSFFIISLFIIQTNSKYLSAQSESIKSVLDVTTPENLNQDFIDFQNLEQQINETYFNNIQSHIENLSSFGSRYTGYSGYEESVTYIENFFQSIPRMESVETIPYEIVVPIEQETYLQIGSANYSAYTLLPNSVHTGQTPLGGVTGNLVYGGSGLYSDLDGKKINGSIVVLEFNSADNWINVASLGAKGVIFLSPNDSNRFEAEQKTIDVPLYFPRIYVDIPTSSIIKQLALQDNQTGNIFSNMQWKTIEAENIVGIYPGTSNDKVIISAYYDSTSIVPSLSPGADEASGISTLLELIRYMDDNDIIPQKSIMFLALSGHNQAAAGAREFVQQNYHLLNVDSGIKLFLSLDLSATNNKIGITSYSYLYKFKLQFTSGNNLINRVKGLAEILENYANEIQEQTDQSFEVKRFVNNQNFEDIAPIVYFGDQEPFIASNTLGLSFFTAESHRYRFNTPFDLVQNLNMEYLKSQVVYSFGSLIQLMTKENLDSHLDLHHKDFSLRHNTHVGFGTIQGNVKEFDEKTAWLANVPNAMVKITAFDTRTLTSAKYSFITKADSSGFYEVHGVSSSQPDSLLEFRVEAYYFDSEGLLTKAINLGSRGKIFKNFGTLSSKVTNINPTVMDSGTLAFFEVTHPYTQAPSAENLNYKVVNPTTRSELFSYGFKGQKTVSLVFIPPDTPSVVVGTLPDGVLAVYATNSNEIEQKGRGFQLNKGEFKNLGISAFISTRDLLSITQTYIDLYTEYNIFDALVDDAYQKASTIILTATVLKNNYNYSLSIGIIKQGQTLAYDSFSQARGVITDGTSSTIFFAILLIPFSFALTSLLFSFDSGKKKIIVTGIVYGLILAFFYLIHPGLHLSSNIGMIIIGVIATIFVFPALMMIYLEGYDFLKNLRVRMTGSHFADTSRSSTILVAMSTGISRMKKRKGRTMIALSGIVLITFSLTLFTSASTQVSVFSRGSEFPTPYEGVYFRTKDWEAPISESMLDIISARYGSDTNISTRWWLYPAVGDYKPAQGGYANILNNNTNLSWESWALLGVSPEEVNFQPVESTLISGRWFQESNQLECILPSSAAEQLEVSVNDTVKWAGTEFTVIGIFDGNLFDNLKDYDNEQITPRSLSATSTNVHISSNQVFLVPSDVAKNFGATLASISIIEDQTTSYEIAESVSTTFGRFIEVRVGYSDTIEIFKRSVKSIGRGFIEIGLPLAIAILLMVNTSISTVYESKKEINIFTSLGLAPFHIAGLFLAEFLVYAVLGSILGYLSGITVAVTMSSLGLLPESLAINYSSGSVINALGFGMAGILLATIYPLRISAKMSVPSIKRSWELGSKPDGDNWTIVFPFVAATEQEAMGIIEFLREYLSIYESDSVGGTFFAENIRTHTTSKKFKSEKHLLATVNLAPFDVGIKQQIDLYTYLDEIKFRYVFEIDLVHLDGILSVWENSVKKFINVLRKQLLIWRSLSKEDKNAKTEAFTSRLQKKG